MQDCRDTFSVSADAKPDDHDMLVEKRENPSIHLQFSNLTYSGRVHGCADERTSATLTTYGRVYGLHATPRNLAGARNVETSCAQIQRCTDSDLAGTSCKSRMVVVCERVHLFSSCLKQRSPLQSCSEAEIYRLASGGSQGLCKVALEFFRYPGVE